ncbi:MAG: hypothetical protein J6W75_14050 [Bacteroidaceae bacterium]|nr:hypothetical protein [Bacteroidaceae bacterium]
MKSEGCMWYGLAATEEWKKLPEEIRSDFVRTEVERREKECVSYAHVWGEDKYAVGKTYYQMHTDYYNEVGHKYGLERTGHRFCNCI